MAKCPNCDADIDHLDYQETKTYSGDMTIEDGRVSTTIEWFDSEIACDCPECGEEIATDEATAEAILKGGYVEQTQTRA